MINDSLELNSFLDDEYSLLFCREFERNNKIKRFLFGCNDVGKQISKFYSIDGFVDD